MENNTALNNLHDSISTRELTSDEVEELNSIMSAYETFYDPSYEDTTSETIEDTNIGNTETSVNSESETEVVEVIEENTQLEPIIPENSKTILMNEYTSRFTGAIWYEKIKTMNVILAGLGGIGSYIGFLLSRLHINQLLLYDSDIVEAANISGQMYPTSSIGNYKTTALSNLVREFSEFYKYSTFSQRYTENSMSKPIMICGFDNMEARKVFFSKWLKHVRNSSHPEECLFIDGRLAAEEFQILSIQGNDERAIKEYQDRWLFSDDEAEATICSYKQTTFMANIIASMMVNVFVNFVANLSNPAPVIPRDIPFFISYSADTMFTKIEM